MIIRRRLLQCVAGFAALRLVRPALASPLQLQAALDAVARGRVPRAERVRLDLPPLVENGNAVPLSVTIDSPMTDSDHVTMVHIFNEKNPQPRVISVAFIPDSGRAAFSTRIKLADSQRVIAIAETNDGRLWSAEAHVVVTVAACIEEAPE